MNRFVVELENGKYYGMFGVEFDNICNETIWVFWNKKELTELLTKYGYKNFKIRKLGK